MTAGFLKISHTPSLARDIYNYRILPLSWIHPVAGILPWMEIVLGTAITFGFWTESSLLLSSFLCLIFTIAVGTALTRGLDVNCGCFHGVQRVSVFHLFLNIILLVIVASLLVQSKRQKAKRLKG